MMRHRYQRQWYLLLTAILICASSEKQQDLYKLLGVKKTATVKEIKSAYRRKALDTHPDKNKNVPAEEAAEEFRQVVHAFEILSDEASRKRYDRTGRTDDNKTNNGWSGGGGGQYRGSSFQWNWHSGFGNRPRKLKDKFEVQQAQSRVLHVVSLSQLFTIMLDDADRLERNLLICFTTPKTQQQADDEMVFPYPFAAMSSQGIWWEDLLQTVRIRFYRNSELSRFFGVEAQQVDEKPLFVFAKRGQLLNEETAQHLPRLHSDVRSKFETWAWQQIEVVVSFHNQHDHAVEVYWVHGNTAHKKMTMEPGEISEHTTMLSHEWYVRDVRVDAFRDSPGRHKLSNDSSLGSWKILKDESPQTIIIPKTTCMDLSGHCAFWKVRNECRKNPTFMGEKCVKTCGLCHNVKDEL